MAEQRISTGISDLDSLLEGGFIAGRSYLIEGDSGTGKSMSCMQFVKKGLDEGVKSIYVTVNEKASHLLESARSMGWDLQRHVEDRSLIVLDASSYYNFSSAVRGKGAYFQKFVSELAAQAKLMEATQLVIDPISPLISAHRSDMPAEECARYLIDLLESRLATTNLFTSYSSARTDQDLSGGREEFFTAGVLVLKIFRQDGYLARSLSVKKMRGTAIEPSEYRFRIVKGQGIVLLPSQSAETATPKRQHRKKAAAPSGDAKKESAG